jgi:GTP-binding protein
MVVQPFGGAGHGKERRKCVNAPASVREANQLFSGPVSFLRAVVALDGLPDHVLPEIAFAGRSNVGKSSLINALTGRMTLARTSVTPGRTQQLILFDMGSEERQRLRLVDMPGYGYAKAPKSDIASWTQLVKTYLRGRPNLKRTMLLIDSRHGVKPNDEEMMKMLDEAAVSYQLILTKADKLSQAAQGKALEAAQAAARPHPAAFPEVLLTSSDKGWGIEGLRQTLTGLALPVEATPS